MTKKKIKFEVSQLPTSATEQAKRQKHPKCLGWYDAYTGEFDCGYDTVLTCEDCKYGIGRKDPEAKCNRA